MAPVRVRLVDARVYSDMEKRFDLIATAAQELLVNDLDAGEVGLIEGNLSRAVHAYFLLSEAYKVDKLGHREQQDEHWTESPKKAALTTLAIMLFRPFRVLPKDRRVVANTTPVANQMLALCVAASLMEQDWPALTWERQRRLFNLLGRIGAPPLLARCLNGYRRDQARGITREEYSIDIDRDLIIIDSLILLFESPLRP